MTMEFAIALHGGAGAQPGTDYTAQKQHMGRLIVEGKELLLSGMSAVDAVATVVADMEASGLYVAGKGSMPNRDGVVELDASIMDGSQRRAGAVGALPNVVSPVKVALSILVDGRQVMLAGDGAVRFAKQTGAEIVDDPDNYYCEHERHGARDMVGSHGTVGAVALDTLGNLAGATSTGGLFHKEPGRIGDTPLIGAGTWADDLVAVSCTGVGEAFIRSAAAHDVAARMRYSKAPLDEAARAVLEETRKCGGDGGLIAIDKDGHITMPFNSHGMKCAAVSSEMDVVVRVFEKA
ncbi:MAG: isoaspartyl peptidase/L-asparaginase [Rhizobiales bacterium]|nr:isoaspartyl peptidase/L-asparaginase [Hyphomicrobiales bacterium]